MPSHHPTGRVVTLAVVAFLCGLGSGARLPVQSATAERPVYRLAALPQPPVVTPAVRTTRTGPPQEAAAIMAPEFSTAFADIAAAVTPAVVRIQTERSLARLHANVPDRMRDFFGLPDGRQDAPLFPEVAGGSGVLISEDGLILTNNHVIAGASRITVTLWDKRIFEATVVGSDPTTDIALVLIDESGLPSAPLGDSEKARVGEWVLAIGNPGFQDSNTLDFTVTSGIISAKGRPLDIIRQELGASNNPAAPYAIEDFIQTDAAINPGNSGGPLIDLAGRVIGINTAIASGTGFNQGYGFAVPINVARRVMDDLLEHGRVRRPLLGISIQDVSAEDAEVYGLPRIAGVLVEDFQDDSPAERAGLRRHDVIVSVDGDRVDRLGQFQRLVAQHAPGDDVDIEVIRYGQRVHLPVRLKEAEFGSRQVVRTEPERGRTTGLGIDVVDLTPTLARERDFGRNGGVLIASVDPAGPARRKNITPNVLIRSINRQAVTSAAEAQRMLNALPSGGVVSFLLEDATGSTFIRNVRVP
jgi:serine protease Do